MTTKKFRCRECGKSRVGRSVYVAQDERGGYYCDRKRVICAGKPDERKRYAPRVVHYAYDGDETICGLQADYRTRSVDDLHFADEKPAAACPGCWAAESRCHACQGQVERRSELNGDGECAECAAARRDDQIKVVKVEPFDHKYIEGLRPNSPHNGRQSSVDVRVVIAQGGKTLALDSTGGGFHSKGGLHCVCGTLIRSPKPNMKLADFLHPVHQAHMDVWRREADRAFPRCRWCGMRGCEKLSCEESTAGKKPELVMHFRHATFVS